MVIYHQVQQNQIVLLCKSYMKQSFLAKKVSVLFCDSILNFFFVSGGCRSLKKVSQFTGDTGRSYFCPQKVSYYAETLTLLFFPNICSQHQGQHMSKSLVWNLINFFSHEHNCFWHHLHQTRSLIIQTIFVISTIFFNVLTYFMKKNMSANKVFFHVIKTSVFRESLFFTEHISFIRFFRISSTSSFF